MMRYLLLGDCAEKMRDLAPNSVDAIVTDPPYGLAFMGANWDYGVPGEMFWREALRVAKPGAHILAFGGTRTYHRLACAIEDAGWEIRDCIMWVYGSGFPKSMDVAKAIDKASGYEGEVIGTRIIDVGMQGGNMHAGRQQQQQQQQVRALSPEAAAWNGWGTCLKPAVEPIVVARKPLEGTVAANVLKYGTGAINIDGCRVAAADGYTENIVTQGISTARTSYDPRKQPSIFTPSAAGRFPANLIHDGSDEVLALFPRNDTGSAARFFYCAKASRSERGEGNVHPTVKPLALMRYLVRLVTRKGGVVLDPFMGSGTTGVACIETGRRFIGIERDPHYYEIASRRVNDAKPIPPTTTQEELSL